MMEVGMEKEIVEGEKLFTLRGTLDCKHIRTF